MRARLEIKGVPAVLLLDSEGSEIDRIIGFKEDKRNEFYQTLKDYAQGKNTLVDLMAQQAKNPDSIEIKFKLGRKYTDRRELEKASKEFERIILASDGNSSYEDIHAKSFYMLGKIHDRKRNKKKAVEFYEKFLDLWKDADPGIAEIKDARKRLARLK